MNEQLASRKSDKTPLVLFHISGDYGYCKDVGGNISKEALNGLIVGPTQTTYGSPTAQYAKGSLMDIHLHTNVLEVGYTPPSS